MTRTRDNIISASRRTDIPAWYTPWFFEQIQLHLCCEKKLYDQVKPGGANIFENACINGPFLEKLYGGSPETRRDSGQRAKKGCRCTRSIDIGSYQDHPCYHNSLFCYAHTKIDTRIKQGHFQ